MPKKPQKETTPSKPKHKEFMFIGVFRGTQNVWGNQNAVELIQFMDLKNKELVDISEAARNHPWRNLFSHYKNRLKRNR